MDPNIDPVALIDSIPADNIYSDGQKKCIFFFEIFLREKISENSIQIENERD